MSGYSCSPSDARQIPNGGGLHGSNKVLQKLLRRSRSRGSIAELARGRLCAASIAAAIALSVTNYLIDGGGGRERGASIRSWNSRNGNDNRACRYRAYRKQRRPGCFHGYGWRPFDAYRRTPEFNSAQLGG